MTNQKNLNKCYDEWAKGYDKDAKYNPPLVKSHKYLLKLLQPRKDDIGLDLGCGTGLLTFKIAEKVKKIVGVDISDEMLKVARSTLSKNFKNVELKKADITKKLNFPDNYFDFVISSLTLCHIEDLKPIYREVYRILRPGGVFVFDEFTSQIKKPFTTKYKDLLAQYHSRGQIFWTRRPIDEHKKLAEKTGFQVGEIITTKIDKELKEALTEEDYKINKGLQYNSYFKLIKPRVLKGNSIWP